MLITSSASSEQELMSASKAQPAGPTPDSRNGMTEEGARLWFDAKAISCRSRLEPSEAKRSLTLPMAQVGKMLYEKGAWLHR